MKRANRRRCSSRRRTWRLALVTLAAASLAGAPIEAQTTPERRQAPHVWLSSTGEPLPLQTHAEIVEHLRSAEVVDRSPIGRGVTGAERVVLERGGVRVRAAFRKVDEIHRGSFEGLPTSVRRVRDAAAFECAAYEISEALGLGRVPPTVCRQIGKTSGSVQIWLERSMTETDVAEKSLKPPDMARWLLQKHEMYVFDALIANLDRNQGNVLIDSDWRLWLIDHTRAFIQTSDLLNSKRIARCSQELWSALRNLDEASLQQRLEPFLTKGETAATLKRRVQLVKHIEKLIAANGEAAVLFVLDPA